MSTILINGKRANYQVIYEKVVELEQMALALIDFNPDLKYKHPNRREELYHLIYRMKTEYYRRLKRKKVRENQACLK